MTGLGLEPRTYGLKGYRASDVCVRPSCTTLGLVSTCSKLYAAQPDAVGPFQGLGDPVIMKLYVRVIVTLE